MHCKAAMVMGSRMQHGSAQPTAAHALQGKRNARVVGCDEDNAQPAAAYALQRYEILLIDPWLTHDTRSCPFSTEFLVGTLVVVGEQKKSWINKNLCRNSTAGFRKWHNKSSP